MTTSTLSYPRAAAVIAASCRITRRTSPFSLSDWLDVLRKSLAMMRAVPNSGRITAKHMEKVCAISASI